MVLGVATDCPHSAPNQGWVRLGPQFGGEQFPGFGLAAFNKVSGFSSELFQFYMVGCAFRDLECFKSYVLFFD